MAACGVVLVLGGVLVAVSLDRVDGLPRGLGLEGILALVLATSARGVRGYQHSARASLPARSGGSGSGRHARSA